MERATKSAHVVASIDDLLSKILLLLPIKDLLRFKSVSKHWWALISDPNFCHLRSTNPNPAAAGIFLPSAEDYNLIEYVPFSALNSRTFQFNFSTLNFRSCNGLLLVESNSSCLVYNPTTDLRLELPKPVGGFGFMTLAFDPVKSHHYNVVSIRFLKPRWTQFVIEMYSSETHSWEVYSEPLPAKVDFLNGVYWNGAVHWLSVGNERGVYFKVEHKVLEKMPIMPFPKDKCNPYFGHSCDHLHLILNPDSKSLFAVYEMKRDYSEWFVKYRVDLCPAIKALAIDSNYVFSVLNVIRGEAEEDAFLVVVTRFKIIRYNLVSETFEKLYEIENSRYPRKRGIEYIESLFCV